MAQIFVSYAREDQTRILPLVHAFEARGWSVFWDRRIPAGQTWRTYIEKALTESNVVVVVWTRHSLNSNWVVEEAEEGKRRGILLPVLFGPVEIPMGFRSIQTADLKEWDGDNKSPSFQSLTNDIEIILLSSGHQTSVIPRRQESLDKSEAFPWVTGRSSTWVFTLALTIIIIFLGYFLFLLPRTRTEVLTSDPVPNSRQSVSLGTDSTLERQLSPNKPSQPSRVTVDIYIHDAGLTRADAEMLQKKLFEHGIHSTTITHRDPAPPDAIFIGAMVGAEEARVVIGLVPYEIKFLFRPDYPSAEGGDEWGYLIGLGYMSTHYQHFRGRQSEPIKISREAVQALTQEGLSNVEFQRRLRNITQF